jgi:hypothetical protein
MLNGAGSFIFFNIRSALCILSKYNKQPNNIFHPKIYITCRKIKGIHQRIELTRKRSL